MSRAEVISVLALIIALCSAAFSAYFGLRDRENFEPQRVSFQHQSTVQSA